VTPTFKLTVSGSDITSDVSSRLVQIEWTDGVEERSDVFTVTLHDADNRLAVPKKGAKIELAVGYNGALQKVGSYSVDEAEIEGPPDKLTVRGSAAPFVDSAGKSATALSVLALACHDRREGRGLEDGKSPLSRLQDR
jgi:phage protein D